VGRDQLPLAGCISRKRGLKGVKNEEQCMMIEVYGRMEGIVDDLQARYF
jgi:hypothetical protein